jgi:hypothetical protein
MCKASRFVCIVSKFVWVSEGVEVAGNSPLIPRVFRSERLSSSKCLGIRSIARAPGAKDDAAVEK